MNAITEQARRIVRDLDDIKETVCRGGAVPQAIATRIIEVKRAAARLAGDDPATADILVGYQRDVHGELTALRTLIDQQGCGFLVTNRRALQVAALAAENFAERARNYLALVEQQEEADRRLLRSGGVIRSIAEIKEVTDAA
jgi:hypothetical protein